MKEKVLKMLEATGTPFDSVVDFHMSELRNACEQVRSVFTPEIEAAFDQYKSTLDKNLPALKDKAVDIYSEQFSEAEIDEIIAFATSPAIVKMRSLQPILEASFVAGIADWVAAYGHKDMTRLKDLLNEPNPT